MESNVIFIVIFIIWVILDAWSNSSSNYQRGYNAGRAEVLDDWKESLLEEKEDE